jgi:hypothetical protein
LITFILILDVTEQTVVQKNRSLKFHLLVLKNEVEDAVRCGGKLVGVLPLILAIQEKKSQMALLRLQKMISLNFSIIALLAV